MARRPNIILCLADQLRAFELGCYGNPAIHTPNIDGLAADGARFAQAVTNYPVCMAARSVTLSGQYNRTCTGGVSNVAVAAADGRLNLPEYPFDGRPHLPATTLPELLHGLGYRNTAIGKWHIHSWPHDVGFDDYLIPRVHHAYSHQSFTENGGPEFVPPGFSVDYEAGRVERFLAERRGEEQPFFLYYNISPPHCPMSDAPERYLRMYDPAALPIRPNVDLSQRLVDQDHWFKVYRWDYRYYNFHLPYTEDLPEDFTLRRVIAEYYGMTTWVDDCVGRMLAALEANGLAEDTIVVFASDHGDNLGSHGLVQKGNLHEESVRIPLIVRWPTGLAPAVIEGQVAGLVDLAPTLLALAGAEPPAHMHGRSLAARLRGQTPPAGGQDHAFIESGNGVAVRTPTHLYALPFEPDNRRLAAAPQLFFDLANDPYELENLAGGGLPPEAGRLDALLRAWDAATPWMEGGRASNVKRHRGMYRI